MIKQIFIGSILAVVITGVFYYWQLGGTSEAKIRTTNDTTLVIYADHFSGIYNMHEVERLFDKAKQNSQKHESVVTIINVGSDERAKYIDQWIGITPLNTTQLEAIESTGYTTQELSRRFVQATIDAHNAVMPRPQDVREQASDFAIANNLILDTLSIEMYYSERNLKVYFPVISR